jgi:hypothetical protein
MTDFREIRIIYNNDTDETFIAQNEDFVDLELITQLDVLQDAIAELTEVYNSKLKELNIHNKI